MCMYMCVYIITITKLLVKLRINLLNSTNSTVLIIVVKHIVSSAYGINIARLNAINFFVYGSIAS